MYAAIDQRSSKQDSKSPSVGEIDSSFDLDSRISQKVELTEIHTTELPFTTVGQQRLPKVDPYNTQSEKHILQREHLIAQESILNIDVLRIHPAQLLLTNVPSIRAYLQPYRFFRSRIHVRVQVKTAPTTYGSYMVGFLPQDDRVLTKQQISQAGGMIMDLATQKTCELYLPYLNTKEYWDLGEVEEMEDWAIYITTLQAFNLADVSDDPDIRVEIYAAFVEPEVAGVVPYAAVFQMNTNNVAAGFFTLGLGVVGENVRRAFEKKTTATAEQFADWTFDKVKDQFTTAEEELRENELANQGQHPRAAQLDVMGDLSSTSQNVMLINSVSEPYGKTITNQPNFRNTYRLSDIVQIPTFIQTYSLITSGQQIVISCDPFKSGSYFRYLAKMFKYYRTGVKLFLNIQGNPLGSSLLRMSYYPVGAAGPTAIVGDVPAQEIQLRGNHSYQLHCPYLYSVPWQPTSGASHYPQLIVRLVSPDSSITVEPSPILLQLYMACDSNCEFAGYQSAVANFQSLVSTFTSIPEERVPHRSYMGQDWRVGDLVSRYSTRGPGFSAGNSSVYVPTDYSEFENEFDNFEYIGNLYKYYAGPMTVKYLFSQAPANGMLEIVMSNSNFSATGSDNKIGNGASVTHQAVWPTFEVESPYFRTTEFAKVGEQPDHFIRFSQESVLATAMVAASPNFRLFTLMPIPDFALFQSFTSTQRLDERYITQQTIAITGGAPGIATLWTKTFAARTLLNIKVTGLVTGGHGGAVITTSSSNPFSGVVNSAGDYVTALNYSTSPCHVQTAFIAQGTLTFYIHVTGNTSASHMSSVEFSPWANVAAGDCPQTLECLTPIQIAEENVGGLLVHTQISSCPTEIGVNISNITTLDLLKVDLAAVSTADPINTDGTVSVDGPVQVYGTPSPTIPVFVTQYGSVS